ncbi:pilus assembly protein TadG-related protein [Janthinobacterium agaricidamnosum]|uniref:Uncharacterized domain protein n=1 Tax=Janthinobacterium agaricidamnosum NBRC 102515 = DSM 9628 TaxID=1349767 RepID=W0VDF8_9BURK|nr:pilus assembly protein TadG-related protein [Janthinobacterium agaricidamnosum]CDG85700.1 putative uncharacterized domain protein [Janthinobacterium agaricidamnosum NBRC 102515 = DSM 9628]
MANKLPRPRRQRGSLIMIFAILLIAVIGFIGMALDLAQVFARKTELQIIADSAALAAAQELNGSAAGVASALAAAKSSAAEPNAYQFRLQGVILSDDAVKFSASADAPEGDWQSVVADPTQALFVKVDTARNALPLGTVGMYFMGALSSSLARVQTSGRAVAGRSSIRLTPLAVCAMSPQPLTARNNPGPPARTEAVEYGFRRGVGYNLLALNPHGATPANYLLNPIDPLDALGAAAHVTPAAAAPFVCSGSMPMVRIGHARIHAHSPFPPDLLGALNSRFNQYGSGWCHPKSAPPDTNIRVFTGAGPNWWMNNAPAGPSAAPAGGTPLHTVADIEPPVPASVSAASYGPLWSYARAAQYASPRPAADFTAFPSSAWAQLYPGTPAAPVANSNFLSSSPYSLYVTAPAGNPGLALRRVLFIPLLACPLPAASDVLANVLAIGKFFMTAPAVPGMISAEFAGVVAEQAPGGPVELQQ